MFNPNLTIPDVNKCFEPIYKAVGQQGLMYCLNIIDRDSANYQGDTIEIINKIVSLMDVTNCHIQANIHKINKIHSKLNEQNQDKVTTLQTILIREGLELRGSYILACRDQGKLEKTQKISEMTTFILSYLNKNCIDDSSYISALSKKLSETEIELLCKEAKEKKDMDLCNLLEKVKSESCKRLFPMQWKGTDIRFHKLQSGRC